MSLRLVSILAAALMAACSSSPPQQSGSVTVDEQKALKLMAQYPSLIKRPVLDTGSKLLVGFSPESYTEALK